MGNSEKIGLLILMGLMVGLARFLEGEVKVKRSKDPIQVTSTAIEPAIIAGRGPAQAIAPTAPVTPITATAPERAAPGPKSYKVQKGDTLGRVSQRVYGTTRHWKRLLEANKRLLKGKPERLKPGMTLAVPQVSTNR